MNPNWQNCLFYQLKLNFLFYYLSQTEPKIIQQSRTKKFTVLKLILSFPSHNKPEPNQTDTGNVQFRPKFSLSLFKNLE